jgi:4-hydroxybenzoate polyprenyltransferase
MKQKNKILLTLSTLTILAAIAGWALGYNPVFIIVLGLLVLFLFWALWDLPPKHKTFSYKDQQRAMQAFDRSEQIDMGKPDWLKDKKKHKK